MPKGIEFFFRLCESKLYFPPTSLNKGCRKIRFVAIGKSWKASESSFGKSSKEYSVLNLLFS